MRIVVTTFVAAIGLLLVGTAGAQDCCQPVDQGSCCGAAQGCGDPCAVCCPRKVCKVVCEMKKVKTHCWCVECEEFCAPLPRLRGGCSDPCGSCGDPCGDSCGSCAACCDPRGNCTSLLCGGLPGRLGKRHSYVAPRCDKVRVKKKLVKKEITKEIPVYKCVVVDCCDMGADAGYSAPAEGQPSEAAPQMAPIDEEAAPLPPAPKQ